MPVSRFEGGFHPAIDYQSSIMLRHLLTCSKFQLTGGGIHPAYYWVTGEGVLQRVMLDERKVIELQESR